MKALKPKDVRIGNYFFDDEGNVCFVIGFKPFEHSIRCDEDEGCDILVNVLRASGRIDEVYITYSPNCEGIPLTEEWLVKLGFEKVMKPNTFKNHKLPYWAINGVILFFNESPPENTYLACVGDFVSDFKCGGEYIALGRLWITTVHDLQNFYFANVGKELTIKP